jgi:DNA-directed RNA polymerase subunit alpha
MIQFEKPNFKIVEYVEEAHYGKFEIEPLERGFGTTLGNSLRRVLLSSLPGAAVTSVRINGVLHEFQTIEGVVEDVTKIILNLKDLVLKIHGDDEQTLRINVDREGAVTAADIEADPDVEIINKDHVICTLAAGGSIQMEMTAKRGRGYVRADENKPEHQIIGVIPTDSIYTPIERVSYEVEKTRVGQDANYDKLILEVWTNSSILPQEAVALGSKILIEHFNILTDLDEIANIDGVMIEKEEDPTEKALEMTVEELDLSVRAYNCLKRAGINTVQDLTERSEADMMKVRNLGKKSLKDVKDKLHELGLGLKIEE